MTDKGGTMEKHEYTNETLGVSFSLPKKITVRQNLRIASRMTMMADLDDYYFVFWYAIVPLIDNEDWKCELIPDPKELSFNDDNPILSKIVMWIVTQANNWLSNLGMTEKN